MNEFNWGRYIHSLEEKISEIGCTHFELVHVSDFKRIINIVHDRPRDPNRIRSKNLHRIRLLLLQHGYDVVHQKRGDRISEIYLELRTGISS